MLVLFLSHTEIAGETRIVRAFFCTTHQYKMWYAEIEECGIRYYKNQDSKQISLNVPTLRDKYDDIKEDVDNLPYVKGA